MPMNIFLVHVGDDDFSRVLPKALDRSPSDSQRVKIMAFPPLGIQTLAPVLRQHGHSVRMFDTCHPEMKADHLAQAVAQERPEVIALSFLSTTTYPAAKRMAERLKAVAPRTPIIVGGPFATVNADRILKDCPQIDCRGSRRRRRTAAGLPEQPPRPRFRGRFGLAKRCEDRSKRPASADPGPGPVSLPRSATACPLTISSPCRWMSPRSSRWTSSARCRLREAAPIPASTATSPPSPRASGAADLRSTSWGKCRS